jgi:hypothetical protein
MIKLPKELFANYLRNFFSQKKLFFLALIFSFLNLLFCFFKKFSFCQITSLLTFVCLVSPFLKVKMIKQHYLKFINWLLFFNLFLSLFLLLLGKINLAEKIALLLFLLFILNFLIKLFSFLFNEKNI